MSIVQISTTLRNAPSVGIQSCVYGIECETIAASDPSNIRFELMGPQDKIEQVISKTNSIVTGFVEPVKK